MPIKGTESSQLRQAVVPGAEIYGAVTGLCNHGKGTPAVGPPIPTGSDVAGLGATFDGGGFVIEASSLGSVAVKNACTITGWSILFKPGVTDSIEFDVWLSDYANYPTISSANSIVGGAYPAIVSANQANNGVLTSWNRNVAAGDRIVIICRSRGAPTWAQITLFTDRAE